MDSSSSSAEQRYCYYPKLKWNPQVEEYFIKAYGTDHFARVSEALTRPSSYSCIRVNFLKSTNEAVIEKLTRLLQDGYVDDLDCLSTGKWVSEGNAADDGLSKDNIDRMFNFSLEETTKNVEKPMTMLKHPTICQCQFPGLDHVLFVKGSGPYSIHYGNQSDESVKEVIVSRKCAEAVLRGAQIYVPGLLACSSHVEKGDIVAVSVAVEQRSTDGRWGVNLTRGTVLQGTQQDPQYLERNGMYIGQGITKFSRAGMFRALEGIGVEMTDRVYRLPSFRNPQQGERILDMCAAPGGKTTAIAMLMRDNGEVVAVDRSHNKVMDIKKLAAEMDLTCIRPYRLDALKSVCQTSMVTNAASTNLDHDLLDMTVENSSSKLDNGYMDAANIEGDKTDAKIMNNCLLSSGNRNYGNGRYANNAELRRPTQTMKNGPGRNHSVGGRAENSKGFLPNSFDRVLLDAPCSALGLRPRLFAADETIESLQTHAKYQRRMFDQAVQLVRSGGVIVYSTCTINPGENEALVRYALDTYKFLSLAPQNPRVGGSGLVGKCELGEKYVETWLTEREAELVQRFDPSAPLDTIGFFIAKFNVGQK
ncbi:putative methyltransferase NSUN6 isoform X2 [Phalaenopsis equestris]|uniref:putative methyltransferase NSUN6 isoform X2 n=1 Tax=Phalaenopsis equestris TaxID=78828 RepID=UPI0009E5705C|nr:putative methyltransferase NSUN6 isoform X2 [Phalaenopsis equestris]